MTNITTDITTTCKVEVQKLISRLQEPNRTISQDSIDQALAVLRLIYNPEASLLDKNIVDSVKKNKSMIALEILSFLHDSLTKALCTDELTLQQECAEEWAGKVMENLQLIWDFILECMSKFVFTRETYQQAFKVSHCMEIMKTWFTRVDKHKHGHLNGNDEDLAQTTSDTNAAISIWRTGHNTFEQSVKDVLRAIIYLLVLDNCGCDDAKRQMLGDSTEVTPSQKTSTVSEVMSQLPNKEKKAMNSDQLNYVQVPSLKGGGKCVSKPTPPFIPTQHMPFELQNGITPQNYDSNPPGIVKSSLVYYSPNQKAMFNQSTAMF